MVFTFIKIFNKLFDVFLATVNCGCVDLIILCVYFVYGADHARSSILVYSDVQFSVTTLLPNLFLAQFFVSTTFRVL